MAEYRIASVLETRGEKGGVSINIRIDGTAKTFQKDIKEIHTKEWLKKFSPEDVAYIGFLAATEYNDNRSLIKSKKGSLHPSSLFSESGLYYETISGRFFRPFRTKITFALF
jgi:hypothetical protein